MSDTAMMHGLPILALLDLVMAVPVLVIVGIVCVRCWGGTMVPDRVGWEPQQVLFDQRFGVALGLALTTAWASVTIALIGHALRPGVGAVLATHVGPLPLPPWLALVLQDGHRVGLTHALWATGLWLNRSKGSRPPRGFWPGDQRAFAMCLALVALAFSSFG